MSSVGFPVTFHLVLLHGGFIGMLTDVVCHCLVLPVVHVSSPHDLREVTNSSLLVKVGTDFFGSTIQIGPESLS